MLMLLGFTSMIHQFGPETCLVLIDVQVGVDDVTHWGGLTGRRNNPDAEQCMLSLLTAWREMELPVAFTLHDSVEEKFSFEIGFT